MPAQIEGIESLQCEYVVPDNDTPQLPRWSDTHIQRPALIVTPKTEQDVKDAIRVAKENKLIIVAAGGGHGTFVSVDPASLYLDMKLFKKIALNKDEGTVKVGGGVIVGEDKEQSLFNVLCGAGHGLGVVTELTVSAFPLSSLNVEDNKIWTRSLIFPAPALDIAINAFLDLSHPPAEGYMSLAFARSPPGTPAAGSPIIILGYQYFGPAEQAEKATTLLFQDDVVSKTVVANTEILPFENVNTKMNIYNSHHGHKTIASCRLRKTTAEAIKAGFEKWHIATEDYPDAQQSSLIISAYNIDKTSAIKNEKFVEGRDRNINAFMVMVAKEDKTREAFGPILDDVVAGFRKSDEGMVPRSFPNNLRPGKDLSEMYDTERLGVLRDVKKTWDADGVFWSPYFKAV
ncbi:hypothetical protein ACJA88_003703 [Fusarium oxysporum]